MANPRVLIVSTKSWPIPARIALALDQAGFVVAAIGPKSGFTTRSRAIRRHYFYRFGLRSGSIVRAIVDYSPDLLICADDPAVRELHRIHFLAAKDLKSKASIGLVRLIERSLGPPQGFGLTENKSELLRVAMALGLRCPPTTFMSASSANGNATAATYPVLVKGDGSWGGKFVRIVHNAKQAESTIRSFQLPHNWPSVVRDFLARWLPPSVTARVSRSLGDVTAVNLQEFVDGQPANRAVVCWEGRVLAGVSLRVHKTVYTFGPASIVEIVDVPEMTRAAEALVGHLKLSGMIGLDFVLDPEGQAWFIELNPRVTPACYLRSGGANLSAALLSQMTGQPGSSAGIDAPAGKLITLFPQELQRSAQSEFASTSLSDVPWEDPELVLALLKAALRGGLRKRMGMRRRNRQDILIKNLQKPISQQM